MLALLPSTLAAAAAEHLVFVQGVAEVQCPCSVAVACIPLACEPDARLDALKH